MDGIGTGNMDDLGLSGMDTDPPITAEIEGTMGIASNTVQHETPGSSGSVGVPIEQLTQEQAENNKFAIDKYGLEIVKNLI